GGFRTLGVRGMNSGEYVGFSGWAGNTIPAVSHRAYSVVDPSLVGDADFYYPTDEDGDRPTAKHTWFFGLGFDGGFFPTVAYCNGSNAAYTLPAGWGPV